MYYYQGEKLSARAALISNHHFIAALNSNAFSLIAFPLSRLTNSRTLSHGQNTDDVMKNWFSMYTKCSDSWMAIANA